MDHQTAVRILHGRANLTEQIEAAALDVRALRASPTDDDRRALDELHHGYGTPSGGDAAVGKDARCGDAAAATASRVHRAKRSSSSREWRGCVGSQQTCGEGTITIRAASSTRPMPLGGPSLPPRDAERPDALGQRRFAERVRNRIEWDDRKAASRRQPRHQPPSSPHRRRPHRRHQATAPRTRRSSGVTLADLARGARRRSAGGRSSSASRMRSASGTRDRRSSGFGVTAPPAVDRRRLALCARQLPFDRASRDAQRRARFFWPSIPQEAKFDDLHQARAGRGEPFERRVDHRAARRAALRPPHRPARSSRRPRPRPASARDDAGRGR